MSHLSKDEFEEIAARLCQANYIDEASAIYGLGSSTPNITRGANVRVSNLGRQALGLGL